MEISAICLEWQGREVVVNFFKDITERTKAKNALQESQRMLRLVLDTVPLHVAWKDTQLRFLGCNRALAIDAGLSGPDDIVGL